MGIELTNEQQSWLETLVADGEYPSVEDAVRQIVHDHMAEEGPAGLEKDLDWVKPYIDEALGQIERGQSMTLEEFKARNAARMARLRG